MSTTFDVTGRHVVVTGGANGIGAALAHEAAIRGASGVSIVDVDLDAATSTATAITDATSVPVTAISCDVSDAAAVQALAESIVTEHGVPGLVCANAGVIGPTAPLLDTEPAMAEWILGVNTRGVLHVLQSFGRAMRDSTDGGWLMATASEHAMGVPHLNAGLYTASKHAVLGLCDVLRGELPEHVGISVLCPGLTTSALWNAGRLRPDEFGGALDADPVSGAFMEHAGMPAATVAERAFDGLDAGDFVIPTHYNARDYATARFEELGAAFDRLAAVDTTDYDVTRLVGEMLAQMSGDEG